MESHSVTYHPTEVIVQPLPSAEAGTQLCDPGEMQGWVDLVWPVAYQDGIHYKLNGRDGLDDNRFMLHLKAIDPYVKIEILRLSLSPLSLIKWLNIDSKWPVAPSVYSVIISGDLIFISVLICAADKQTPRRSSDNVNWCRSAAAVYLCHLLSFVLVNTILAC